MIFYGVAGGIAVEIGSTFEIEFGSGRESCNEISDGICQAPEIILATLTLLYMSVRRSPVMNKGGKCRVYILSETNSLN